MDLDGMCDAGTGSADGRAVQLCELREPGAGGASAGIDPDHRGCRVGGAVGGVPVLLAGPQRTLFPRLGRDRANGRARPRLLERPQAFLALGPAATPPPAPPPSRNRYRPKNYPDLADAPLRDGGAFPRPTVLRDTALQVEDC